MLHFSDYQNKINKFAKKSNLVIYGAGTLGKVTSQALKKYDIEVDFFCDSDKRKYHLKTEKKKIISPEKLQSFDKETDIFVCNIYFSSIVPFLKKSGFKNIYNSSQLFNDLDINDFEIASADEKSIMHPLKLKREMDFYNEMSKKDTYINSDKLIVKTIDVQITEKCSMKCKDCCNLMQYYTAPKDSDMDMMFRNIDKLMNCIDRLDEFRVLGGDPFMNKKLFKVINKLTTYEKVNKVVIYTNAKIVPKGENLEALRHKKVLLDITNYGASSTAHDKLVELCKNENLLYSTTRCITWQDCGRIMPYSNKSEPELKHLFNNCCNSDLVSLLHGKLYRCPFSANGVNLKAIPKNPKDEVDLNDESLSIKELRDQIKNLCYEKEYLTACSFCNGRDYSTANIPSAIQTKKPMEYKVMKD
tara:strand:+ start:1505 stop:2752 length:1248 start_codon:yes stop_codon:yes gene_type:complete